jgi:hypothetical protein
MTFPPHISIMFFRIPPTHMAPLTPIALVLLLIFIITSSSQARDCQRSWRRAWRDMTCEQQDEYLEALTSMKESGIYDEFVSVHEFFARLAHGTPEFLPWHR